MGDQLLPLPLTERSVHLCVDMQRRFSTEGPWPTPWMDRVLPVVSGLGSRQPDDTVLIVCILPERSTDMPGMSQAYETGCNAATQQRSVPALFELRPRPPALG